MSLHTPSPASGTGLETSRKPTHLQALHSPLPYSLAELPSHQLLPPLVHSLPPGLPFLLRIGHSLLAHFFPTRMLFPFPHVQTLRQQWDSVQACIAHHPGVPQLSITTCNQIPLKEGPPELAWNNSPTWTVYNQTEDDFLDFSLCISGSGSPPGPSLHTWLL